MVNCYGGGCKYYECNHSQKGTLCGFSTVARAPATLAKAKTALITRATIPIEGAWDLVAEIVTTAIRMSRTRFTTNPRCLSVALLLIIMLVLHQEVQTNRSTSSVTCTIFFGTIVQSVTTTNVGMMIMTSRHRHRRYFALQVVNSIIAHGQGNSQQDDNNSVDTVEKHMRAIIALFAKVLVL